MTAEPAPRRLIGLPPLVGEGARFLVLGSFPSIESLRRLEYYGHPRNHFWGLVSRCFDSPAPDLFVWRREWLIGLGLAVWDVIGSCERSGSLDQAIRDPRPNDLEAFLVANPGVGRIILNGSKAAAEFRRLVDRGHSGCRLAGVAVAAVPSSSPVPSRQWRCLEDKVPAWRTAFFPG